MHAKKILTVLLTVAMVLSAVVLTVSAANDRKLGDINGDGKIGVPDYVILKKTVMKTHQLADEHFIYADINKNNKLDTADYVLLKRHVMGTYKITDPSDPAPETAIEKIISAIGNNKKISLQYESTIGTFKGTTTLSFEVVGGVLNLHGHALTKDGPEIDFVIPMATISSSYSFSGDAAMIVGTQTITGKASGSVVAASYTVDDTSLKNLKLDTSIEISASQEKMINQLCKEAMDQFLFQANNLLQKEKIGVTIADLGFTQFYQDIQDGLLDL